MREKEKEIVGERERKRFYLRVGERKGERVCMGRTRMYICYCEREKECVWVRPNVYVWVRQRGRKKRVRAGERERACVMVDR